MYDIILNEKKHKKWNIYPEKTHVLWLENALS